MASAQTISTAIIGVTGYEGANLARLLATHPHFRLVAATARASAGQRLGQALPALGGSAVAALTITEDVPDAELVFIAAPHGPAATLAAEQLRLHRRVIDLSADFRFPSAAHYAAVYGHAHP
ncbi:MAG: N-acetyl-gamma-glutamyl-phosphate reductase, partial [Ktedonobacterales bacterium]|nr:N-acetyl-gamma-glutamyl-phosphate reductase [Ktedonobacterales bacterium]